MAKRALLIGSQTGGLTGVHTDLDVIQKILKPFGFAACEVLAGDGATRDGILTAYERLIGDHRADDAAVVYYSGHGGRAANPAWVPGAATPQYLQYIVPTDYQTSGAAFHGIFAFELSVLMARLTAAGRNVTVMLDCCHAAMMSRGYEKLTPRALPRIRIDGVSERLDALKPVWDRVGVESNKDAVRLVAADFDRSAYESQRADGRPGGLMTAALEEALGEAGGPGTAVNWTALGSRIREGVMRAAPEQRPQVEGPALRRLFQIEEAGDTDAVAFFRDNGRAALRAGQLLGAVTGATYLVMPPGVTALEPEKSIAKALVQTIEGDRSYVSLDPVDAPIADGALAFPSRFPFGKRPVVLDGVMASLIADNNFVKVAETPGPAIATLKASEGKLVVLDPDGAALTLLLDDDPIGRAAVNAVLTGLARADAVRTLPNGDLPAAIDIAWGRVDGGELIPMQNGDLLHAGEKLFVEIANCGQALVYAGVFDLGIGGDVTLLTTSIPTGIPIAPGGVYRLGEREGQLIGLKTGWNSRVPSDGARREAVVIIAAEEPTQFRALEGKVQIARDKGQSSALDRLLSEIGSATAREIEPDEPRGGRFLTRHIEFQLSPMPRPTADRRARFLVDQSIAPAFLSRAAPPEDTAFAGEIALRLSKLIVHSNRAYWGTTGVRVDALAVTASQKGTSPYTPKTFTFPRIGDEQALPFDDLLIFAGKPARYLDFQLWVSKAKPNSKPLGELIKETLNNKEFQSAATVLAGLAVAAPVAATIVGAAAAAGTIGYFAEKVLTAAVDASIGLYRTSFLPSQQFGLGRHPQAGVIRAQDFSFSFEIVRL